VKESIGNKEDDTRDDTADEQSDPIDSIHRLPPELDANVFLATTFASLPRALLNA
jgi:hypothetical protein